MSMRKKPVCKLSGENGNVFNLLAKVCRVLKDSNMKQEMEECREKVFNSPSYDSALQIMMEYVEVE